MYHLYLPLHQTLFIKVRDVLNPIQNVYQRAFYIANRNKVIITVPSVLHLL